MRRENVGLTGKVVQLAPQTVIGPMAGAARIAFVGHDTVENEILDLVFESLLLLGELEIHHEIPPVGSKGNGCALHPRQNRPTGWRGQQTQ